MCDVDEPVYINQNDIRKTREKLNAQIAKDHRSRPPTVNRTRNNVKPEVKADDVDKETYEMVGSTQPDVNTARQLSPTATEQEEGQLYDTVDCSRGVNDDDVKSVQQRHVTPGSSTNAGSDSGNRKAPALPPPRSATGIWKQTNSGIIYENTTTRSKTYSRDNRSTTIPSREQEADDVQTEPAETRESTVYEEPMIRNTAAHAESGRRPSEGGRPRQDDDDHDDYEESHADDDNDSCGGHWAHITDLDEAADTSSQLSRPAESSDSNNKMVLDASHLSDKNKSNTLLKKATSMFASKKSTGKNQTDGDDRIAQVSQTKSKSKFRLNLSGLKNARSTVESAEQNQHNEDQDDTAVGDDQPVPQTNKKKNSLTGSNDSMRLLGSKLRLSEKFSTIIGKNRSRPSLSSVTSVDALFAHSPCSPVSAADADECCINPTDLQQQQHLQSDGRQEQLISAELIQKLTSDNFTTATVKTLSRDEIRDVMHHVIQLPTNAVSQLYSKNVNGSLLVHLTVDALVEAIKLDKIDAIKVCQFALNGWLPDHLKVLHPLQTDEKLGQL